MVNVPVASPMRFTPLRPLRLGSITVPPLEAWSVEAVQPLTSLKRVRAGTFSTLLAPSLFRTTVPVLIV